MLGLDDSHGLPEDCEGVREVPQPHARQSWRLALDSPGPVAATWRLEGPAVPVKDLDERIGALRAAAKAADAAAKAEGAKAATDRRGGSVWAPPAEFGAIDLTAAEVDLAELVKGPDPQWGREAHPGGKPSNAEIRVPEEHQE